MALAPASDAAVAEAVKRLGSPYCASAELGVPPGTIRRSLKEAELLTPSKRTSRSAERLGDLALYDAGADGGRFDHADMKLQLAPRRLGFIRLNQIRALAAHRLAQGDGVDCEAFAYCIAAVLNTASRGPVRITESSVATWPGLDAETLRLELAKVGIRLAEREIARLITEVTSRRKPIGKKGLGQKLGLTEAERELVDARNIQAVDHSEVRRRERAMASNASRQERFRRKAGAASRAEWLEANNASRTKPWEAEGVSRTMWYARKSLNPAQVGGEVRNVFEPEAETGFSLGGQVHNGTHCRACQACFGKLSRAAR